MRLWVQSPGLGRLCIWVLVRDLHTLKAEDEKFKVIVSISLGYNETLFQKPK